MTYYNADDPVRERPPQGVEPVRAFAMSDGSTIRPGRDRLSLDHPWLVERAELFKPIDGCTQRTREQFRAMLERTERMLDRGRAPRAATPTRTSDPAEEDRALGWGSGSGLSLPHPRPLRLP